MQAQKAPPHPLHPIDAHTTIVRKPGQLPASSVAPPSPNPNSWTAIGPAPLDAGESESGRIAGIAAHPSDANTIYIAAAGGGVWKTTNGGSTWTPLTDNVGTQAMDNNQEVGLEAAIL